MGREARAPVDFTLARAKRAAAQIRDAQHLEDMLPTDAEQRQEVRELLKPFLRFALCANKKCTSGLKAEWQPVLVLTVVQAWNLELTRGGQVTVNQTLCAACKGKVKVEHVLTDAAWSAIEQSMLAKGAPIPIRSRTTLTFQHIDGPLMPDLS